LGKSHVISNVGKLQVLNTLHEEVELPQLWQWVRKKCNSVTNTGCGRNFANATKMHKLEIYRFTLKERKLRNISKEN